MLFRIACYLPEAPVFRVRLDIGSADVLVWKSWHTERESYGSPAELLCWVKVEEEVDEGRNVNGTMVDGTKKKGGRTGCRIQGARERQVCPALHAKTIFITDDKVR